MSSVSPFEAYLAPARARPGLWRVILGIPLTLAIWVGGLILLVLGIAIGRLLLGGRASVEGVSELAQGGSPEGVTFILASFYGIWIGLALTLWLCHRQRFWTLISPEGRTDGMEVLGGFAIAIGYTAATLIPALLIEGPPERSDLALGTWALWLLAFLPLVWIQAGGEEIFFRGYLLQQIAIRLRHPFFWAVLPSAFFGFLHYNPSLPGAGGLYYVLATCMIGLSAAVLTWRTGGLSAAIGLHVGINIFGISIVGAEGLVSGSQLFLYRGAVSSELLAIDTAANVLLLAWLLSPYAPFRRR
ncbi:MAG: CPBP family intramembrane glutamic endopeptidase [Pseudomonadota bacterium]